jgi:anti-sigma B factor antagonist
MQIDKNKRGTVVVVAPHGSLDIDTRKIFQDMLIGLLDTGETAILVDLSHVDFITSTGLSAMLLAAKRVEDITGKFAVCSVNKGIQSVLEISGFDSIIDIYANADEALAKLQ